eukprot:TRINITY_DN30846_c0_g1_i1.p1 TRINITY_DN30846_c0_g1~~TRINITY_DN30846_c0_g1_i1.p1  ORF type:complete len:308 (-),score=27.44 TRINITY_DN30846_c0_g1_i1:64-966(-)
MARSVRRTQHCFLGMRILCCGFLPGESLCNSQTAEKALSTHDSPSFTRVDGTLSRRDADGLGAGSKTIGLAVSENGTNHRNICSQNTMRFGKTKGSFVVSSMANKTTCGMQLLDSEDGVLMVDSQMLRLHTSVALGKAWTIQVSWKPCSTHLWASSLNGLSLDAFGTLDGLFSTTADLTTSSSGVCTYPVGQRVLAFAKSSDAATGLMLLSRRGEVGVFFGGSFVSAPFHWQGLDIATVHTIAAVGHEGTTTFFVDGSWVAAVPSQPQGVDIGRIGGDSEARNPQAVGWLYEVRVYGDSL